MFKWIFGYVGNEEITKGLLSAILKREVSDLKLDNNPILEKGIVILITDYELDSLKEIEKYVTKWNIREEDYQKIVLTDVMEIYIIELPKFERYKDVKINKELNSWVKFINNPEVIKLEEANKEVKQAKKVLEEISSDKRERYLAELREKYIMDQKAIEDAGFDKGLKAGIEKGIEQGIQKGITQGEKQKTIDIVKKMKEQKIDVEIISKITGLSVTEIEDFK